MAPEVLKKEPYKYNLLFIFIFNVSYSVDLWGVGVSILYIT